MTPEIFEIIQKTISTQGHRKPGKAMEAARLVLVCGASNVEACRQTGANRGALHRLLHKFSSYRVCRTCKHAHKSVDNRNKPD